MTAPAPPESPPEPLIELRGLTKRFGTRLALDALELTVGRGEIFGLLGHNGAGKSTAIGLMLGQVWPTAGTARICGHDVHRHRRRALARVGALFETPAFYDYLSGWRNLEIFTQYTAVAPAARLREVVDWVGLSSRIHSRVRTYSHGMRARLALAILALQGANFLLLDEPTNHLDIPAQEVLQEVLERFDGTVLLVSHDRYLVDHLATQIWELRDGRLRVFNGPYQEFLAERERQTQAVRQAAAQQRAEARQQDRQSRKQDNAARKRAQQAAQIEAQIHHAEKMLETLTRDLEMAGRNGAFDNIQRLSAEYAAHQGKLEMLLAEWEKAAANGND